ncbi:MAG: IS3 family transposase [Planctomycetaceae bacterium]|jgi:putative transposase
MRADHPGEPMGRLCKLLGCSRQNWYKHKKHESKKALELEIVVQMVKEWRIKQPKVGTRKLMIHLREGLERNGIKIGRDALFALLDSRGLLVRRRKKKAVTTDSNHPYRKYPNLVKDFIPLRANELWVCDITYLDTLEGFAYLFLITDAYSHKIVGHCVAETLEARWAIAALRQALAQRTSDHVLLHHSDRGSQYCSQDYVGILKEHSAAISMTENGDPYENAVAERINGIIKNELLPDALRSKKEARQLIAQAVETYNNVRLHASVDMLTPAIAHTMTGLLKNHWKPKAKLKNAA